MAKGDKRGNRSPLPLLFALFGGILLIYLSVPQTIGGLSLIADDHTLLDLEGRPGLIPEPTSIPTLSAATARWWQAARWLDDTETWSDTGDLWMATARASLQDATLHQEALRAAAAAYRDALEHGPANPRAWSMLATATFELGGGADQVLPLLEMSLTTGRRETVLVLTRLDLAFDFWNDVDSQMRAELDDQVRLAARIAPNDLAKMARRHFMIETVRDALALEPALLLQFDLAYAKLAW